MPCSTVYKYNNLINLGLSLIRVFMFMQSNFYLD